jgi:hypothetical protein
MRDTKEVKKMSTGNHPTKRLEWKSLSPAHKVASILSYVLYAALAVTAFRDIRRRSPEELNGNKRLWTASIFAMTGLFGIAIPLAPLAYFLFGRKR